MQLETHKCYSVPSVSNCDATEFCIESRTSPIQSKKHFLNLDPGSCNAVLYTRVKLCASMSACVL